MLRDIFTNKWILGGIALLIIVAGGCFFWYQHTTSQYEKEAADTAEFARQWKKERQAKPKAAADPETASPQATAGSTSPTAENQRNPVTKEITSVTDRTKPTHAAASMETAETAEVPVSPHGYGPYPEIPDDYPSKHLVEWGKDDAQMELLHRVLIKLWASGEKNFLGGSTHDGKIYPHYYDTVYIGVEETRTKGGSVSRTTYRKSGPFVQYSLDELEKNPPPHIRILDLETSGIDPYQYLDLP